MLVWDMFRAHLTEPCKKTARNLRPDMAVIPGGLTSVLQPQDVCLNKSCKVRLLKIWVEWMSSGMATLTKGGNLMKPDIAIVVTWVKEAWASIPEEMVRRSFLKFGISNAMDGSQDDALYADDDETTPCETMGDDDDDYTADAQFTQEQYNELFVETDDEEFEGF